MCSCLRAFVPVYVCVRVLNPLQFEVRYCPDLFPVRFSFLLIFRTGVKLRAMDLCSESLERYTAIIGWMVEGEKFKQ